MTRASRIAEKIKVVEVIGEAADSSSFDAVQKVLYRTVDLTCLRLMFSCKPALRIMPSTQAFNNLTDLTTNAPHIAVAQFLAQHSRLTSLEVGACHTSATSICPLALQVVALEFLESLAGPRRCVRAITSVAIPPTNLTAVYIVGQDGDVRKWEGRW
jgi:hypothetical protein